MNHWLIEIMAEEDREGIQRTMRQIRLEEKVDDGRMDYSTMIGRFLVLLGLWMVTFGRHLQKRYVHSWNNVSSNQHRLSVRPR